MKKEEGTPETKETTPTIAPKKSRKKPTPMQTLICEQGTNSSNDVVFKVRASAPTTLSNAEISSLVEGLGPRDYIVIKGRILQVKYRVESTNVVTIEA